MTHASSGQFQSFLLVMPLAKQDPQGYGSAMTYARRYSMESIIWPVGQWLAKFLASHLGTKISWPMILTTHVLCLLNSLWPRALS
jgi:hypothetical protein